MAEIIVRDVPKVRLLPASLLTSTVPAVILPPAETAEALSGIYAMVRVPALMLPPAEILPPELTPMVPAVRSASALMAPPEAMMDWDAPSCRFPLTVPYPLRSPSLLVN